LYSKIYDIPPNERKKVIRDVLETMNLEEFADTLVNKYSGGMIRRLEIACTMLIKPKLLFLDEPTIGLDPSARKTVWERLISFKKEYGSTIFFNTHYMDEADQYADEIAIINNGKIVTIGTSDELKHSIGGDVILFNTDNNVDKSVLERVKRLRSINSVIINNSDIRVIAKDAETILPRVIEVLRGENITVSKVSITKPTLDDVFLKYAGTRLESEGRIGEIRQVRARIRRG
jgi:ABC-2 type transport system ATP-binding protein